MTLVPPSDEQVVTVPAPGGLRGSLRRALPPPQFRALERVLRPSAQRELEALRELIGRREERRLLAAARAGRRTCVPRTRDPLVTVRIATYGRGRAVVDNAVASAIRQTYENLEILVIGDHAAADTVEAMAEVRDPRVRFVNLGVRSPYPAQPFARWLVAGSHPMNVGNRLARGEWIAPCDDDDQLTDDHVERLLRFAQDSDVELAYSKTLKQLTDYTWTVVGEKRFAEGAFTHGSVLLAGALRLFSYSATSWRRREAFDWNLWRRMQAAGVVTGFLDEVTYFYGLDAMARAGLRPESGIGYRPGVTGR